MICHKNAKDHCGRPRWGISGQVVYTLRHFDRPKTWLDSIILSQIFRNLYFEVWRRSLWGWIWCEMSGEGVKLGSKSICHFWTNFDVKPGPQGSSTWDPEESWDVWPSESKIHEKTWFLWFDLRFFWCLVKLWTCEIGPWWCPFELKRVPIERSLIGEFVYDLPRSGKDDFAKFSGGKLRACRWFT